MNPPLAHTSVDGQNATRTVPKNVLLNSMLPRSPFAFLWRKVWFNLLLRRSWNSYICCVLAVYPTLSVVNCTSTTFLCKIKGEYFKWFEKQRWSKLASSAKNLIFGDWLCQWPSVRQHDNETKFTLLRQNLLKPLLILALCRLFDSVGCSISDKKRPLGRLNHAWFLLAFHPEADGTSSCRSHLVYTLPYMHICWRLHRLELDARIRETVEFEWRALSKTKWNASYWVLAKSLITHRNYEGYYQWTC